ncbi:hypothetical protein [Nostoc sp.]|uniref:hypothetical protein n=1 Tax=Nostoc sp. TaxID=1180 RepID=UPI002FF8FCD1
MRSLRQTCTQNTTEPLSKSPRSRFSPVSNFCYCQQIYILRDFLIAQTWDDGGANINLIRNTAHFEN